MEKYESKYDVVLDIIEHPENYTPKQLKCRTIENRRIIRHFII